MNTSKHNEINIGIDTSQSQFDLYVRPLGHFCSFGNNTPGIKKMIKYIQQFDVARILIEATGRLEMDFVDAAHKAKLPVVICNPTQVRQFARATGRVAKTDNLDAQDIARFGEAIQPELTTIKT